MQKFLPESKRSIHSTRIDVIAGDPMPIVPKSVLPINNVSRPSVEDPEYLPDTTSELAASLSALARIVPPEHVQEIYRTIRDIIDRIAPVTHTSLDYIESLNEAPEYERNPNDPLFDQSNIAKSIALSVRDKIKHYEALGTPFAAHKAAQLRKFSAKVRDAFGYLDQATAAAERISASSRDPRQKQQDLADVERLRAGALKKFNDFVAEYNNEVVGEENVYREISEEEAEEDTSENKAGKTVGRETAFESMRGTSSKRTLDLLKQEPILDKAHRLDIFNAFEKRIRELRATGD